MTRGWRRAGLAVGGLGVVLVLWYFVDYRGAGRDLNLRYSRVNDEENGVVLVERAAAALSLPPESDALLRRTVLEGVWDDAIAPVLAANVEALRLADEALACRAFQVPPPDARKLEEIRPGPYPRLALVLGARALSIEQEGRGGEATEGALAIALLGDRLERAKGGTPFYLAALRVKQIGFGTAEALFARTSLSGAELAGFSIEFGRLPPRREGLADALRIYHVRTIRRIPPESPWKNRRALLPFHRALVRDATVPYARWTGPMEEQHVPRDAGDKPEETGEKVTEWMRGCWERGLPVIVSQIRLAVFAFCRETGSPPERLEDLAPRYLESVPRDEFDGAPIRFLPGRQAVYFVGPDLRDDGGGPGDLVYSVRLRP